MYVRTFHIGNYTNIWYNKTLLAWYFKKVKSSSLTGDLQIGPCPIPAPHLLIDFDEWSRSTYLEGMCFVTEVSDSLL